MVVLLEGLVGFPWYTNARRKRLDTGILPNNMGTPGV